MNGVDQNMSGMYLNEFVIWLNDPSTLANLALVTKTPTAGVTNWARFSDPEVDELHLKYRNSSDVEGRKAAYQKIQEKAARVGLDAQSADPGRPHHRGEPEDHRRHLFAGPLRALRLPSSEMRKATYT